MTPLLLFIVLFWSNRKTILAISIWSMQHIAQRLKVILQYHYGRNQPIIEPSIWKRRHERMIPAHHHHSKPMQSGWTSGDQTVPTQWLHNSYVGTLGTQLHMMSQLAEPHHDPSTPSGHSRRVVWADKDSHLRLWASNVGWNYSIRRAVFKPAIVYLFAYLVGWLDGLNDLQVHWLTPIVGLLVSFAVQG